MGRGSLFYNLCFYKGGFDVDGGYNLHEAIRNRITKDAALRKLLERLRHDYDLNNLYSWQEVVLSHYKGFCFGGTLSAKQVLELMPLVDYNDAEALVRAVEASGDGDVMSAVARVRLLAGRFADLIMPDLLPLSYKLAYERLGKLLDTDEEHRRIDPERLHEFLEFANGNLWLTLAGRQTIGDYDPFVDAVETGLALWDVASCELECAAAVTLLTQVIETYEPDEGTASHVIPQRFELVRTLQHYGVRLTTQERFLRVVGQLPVMQSGEIARLRERFSDRRRRESSRR